MGNEQWRSLGESNQPGWTDPATVLPQAEVPKTKELRPASTAERLFAVVIDFVCLKVMTSVAALAIAGVAIPFAMGSGDDPRVATVATATLLAISFVSAMLYFLVFPSGRSGATVGRRIAGIAPRYATGDPVPRLVVVRHDAVLFVLPSILLNPISVIGPRDLAVLVGWCLFQMIRSADGATFLERALGFKMYETQWNS